MDEARLDRGEQEDRRVGRVGLLEDVLGGTEELGEPIGGAIVEQEGIDGDPRGIEDGGDEELEEMEEDEEDEVEM